MCHLSLAIDQSIASVAPVCDAIEGSQFYIRSIRVVPIAWSQKAEIYLSLGGGSHRDLETLLVQLKALPAVLSTQHTMPPV